ncbi:MAG: RDD family protein [Bacteriovoracia bacterium]
MKIVRAKVSHRIAAKFIDLFLVMFVGIVLPQYLGPFLGFAYSLAADGLDFKGFKKGQSVGKKLLGLQAVSTTRRAPANYRDSAIRNAPVAFATFFAIIPIWGWIFLILVGFPLLVMEIYLMVRVKTGDRLGDVMADTEVIEVPAIAPKL